MIVAPAAATLGLALAVVTIAVGLVALLTRALGTLDAEDWSEPDWWPEFERAFARYAGERDAA
jgi:hypothetical protein